MTILKNARSVLQKILPKRDREGGNMKENKSCFEFQGVFEVHSKRQGNQRVTNV